KFNWQNGFGAFTYSHSHLDIIIRYILNQKAHHKKKTFKKEYLESLAKYDVEFKKEYLFDWLE
ncbi:MAG TPA: transposase, partial [Bacteroidia bacterium]|nr:transposase [Bacteroidia bacterium]